MKPKTFAEVELKLGIKYNSTSDAEKYSLPKLYHMIRNTDFWLFTIGDLCRCLRQNLYLDYLMEYALGEFEKDIFCGEQYDGEMLAAFIEVDKTYWEREAHYKQRIKNILESNVNKLDDEMKKDMVKLMEIFKMV